VRLLEKHWPCSACFVTRKARHSRRGRTGAPLFVDVRGGSGDASESAHEHAEIAAIC
jgi:hypothetical protein